MTPAEAAQAFKEATAAQAQLAPTLRESKKVLNKYFSDSGLNEDWRQLSLSITALQCGGWIFRGVVPWTKKGVARPQRGRFRGEAEFAVWGSKGPMPRGRAVGGASSVLPGHVEAVPVSPARRRHQTEKPVALMRELVRICTPGGVVLDPFTGGGSTGLACLHEGYRFIGAELVGTYLERAENALKAAA